ncbi:MAG: M3 family oligoendopeptidase [Chloroflexi bacterium]|nr:M3 family oligoendopeptidase [Chloroflexota bacterium]
MTTTDSLGKLPHWDLDSIFPGLDSVPFHQAMRELVARLDDLDKFLVEQQIAPPPSASTDIDAVTSAIEGYLERINSCRRALGLLRLYVLCSVDTDTSNDLAQRRSSESDPYIVRVQQQMTYFQSWLGKQSALLPEVLSRSKMARAHTLYLQVTAEQSRYLMSDAEESLAAELAPSGMKAWTKLHSKLWSTFKIPLERDGKVEQLPMAEIQNLASLDPDGYVRQRAAEAEVAGWASMREPLAAALNGVIGAKVTLNKRRGRTDALHAALDQARIDRATLDVLLTAIQDSLPSFRQYLKAKAVALGKETLPWWDVYAPMGQVDRRYTFSEAQAFITTQFERFSPQLGKYANRAFELNWIDAEPRAGKAGGAYTRYVPDAGIARILCNFDGSLAQVFFIAHELGHAYHAHCQVGKTRQQCESPMTLNETASLFCETLVTDQALANAASPQEELAILNTFLGTMAFAMVVDMTQCYLFEKEVFERREKAELSADELCEISQRCQVAVFGDGLDPSHLHPYAWTALPHNFMSNISFYNFPYAFGLLFSLGLYAQYQQRGSAFIPEFEALLASTGEVMPSELAARFGIDLSEPGFWKASLGLIEKRIQRFQELCVAPKEQ